MDVVTDDKKIEELLTRGVENVYPSHDEVAERFKEGKKLRIYLGIDATGSELHLGHTVPLLFLKRLYDMGHKPILLVGDFTSLLGDPTDKDAQRIRLTRKEVQQNMSTYLEQAARVIPVDDIEVHYQSEWYENMSLETFINIAYHTTNQQLMDRDMFKRRIKAGKVIHTPETWYPFLQGYDSVEMDVDGEVGGNDQTFNMLMGRDLMAKMKKKDKMVFSLKLLVDPSTGKKLMSKTEGDYISLESSPQDMYGGIMALSDASIPVLFESITDIPMERVFEINKRLEQEENPKVLKEELAYEIVRMYHDPKVAEKAQNDFRSVFSKREEPDIMPEFQVPKEGLSTVDILVNSGMAASKAEAKRLIDGGAVTIQGTKIKTWDTVLKSDTIIKIGAHRFLKLTDKD